MKPWVLGVTGGIGSGKTTVAEMFAAKGVGVVDSDEASRWVVAPGQPALRQIVDRFGPGVLQVDGELNRAELRRLIFDAPAERRWLEQLLHPLIRAEVDARLSRATSPYAVLVSPLLIESGQVDRVQRLLVVDAPEVEQLQRAMRRDGADEAQIRAILAAQATREQRLKAADDIIRNDRDLARLASEVERLHHFYLTLCEGSNDCAG